MDDTTARRSGFVGGSVSAVLFGLLAALANAGQALISKELTYRAPARQLIGVLYVGGVAQILLA